MPPPASSCCSRPWPTLLSLLLGEQRQLIAALYRTGASPRTPIVALEFIDIGLPSLLRRCRRPCAVPSLDGRRATSRRPGQETQSPQRPGRLRRHSARRSRRPIRRRSGAPHRRALIADTRPSKPFGVTVWRNVVVLAARAFPSKAQPALQEGRLCVKSRLFSVQHWGRTLGAAKRRYSLLMTIAPKTISAADGGD